MPTNDKYVVVLERGAKVATIVLSAQDYEHSISTDRANNIKMYWGSGARWTVVRVLDYDAYQNQTDSTPFAPAATEPTAQ